jgi:hypothetical protein
MLHKHPELARIADAEHGLLPLHLAARDGNITVVKPLVEVYPEGASKKSRDGRLPIHLAADRAHGAIALLLLKIDSAASRVKDKYGKLPVHCAPEISELLPHYRITRRPRPRPIPCALTAATLAVPPDAARENLPDVLAALIHAHRAGVTTRDNDGDVHA